jgi:feruloyl esterase
MMQMKWGVAAFALATALAGGTAQAQSGDTCTALASGQWLTNSTVTGTRWVAADATKSLPAYCEVKATIRPAAGSTIGVVYRLPEKWNGKLLGFGGGGWAGSVIPQTAEPGLKRGYATAQTDGGHPGTNVWDTAWATNPASVTDFAYRAVHEMTVAGKSVVQRYYGRVQDKAYFQGCSTGGRMALMEAQRFPGDYNGIISGAPVYSLQVQTSAILRNQVFAKATFSPAQLKLVQDSAVKSCDAADGLQDGIIAAPASCAWKPAVLACKPGQSGDSCLAPAQVSALDTLYGGIKAPNGSWAAFPLSKGGEAGWTAFIATAGGNDPTNGGGMVGLSPIIFGRQIDPKTLSVTTDVPAARNSAFARQYEAVDPDLRKFVERGGRLILWHGESDPGPSPVGSADYYKAVQRTAPAAAKKGVRLFMAPGVSHCGGGPGADQPDTLTALENWVEKGQAPMTLIATKRDNSMTRPLCPYPAVAHYAGSGDANDPKSYSCR